MYRVANYTEDICGRVCRAEPGKEAEIFTLILRGTVEESWEKKATEDMEIIEINEQELDLILQNKEINKQEVKQLKFKNDLLRF